MTTTRIAVGIAALGAVAIVAGTAVLWGLGVALITAGVLAVGCAVALYDPADRRT